MCQIEQIEHIPSTCDSIEPMMVLVNLIICDNINETSFYVIVT